MMSEQQALQRAVEATGGPAAMAKALGITTSAVSQWRVAPPRRVLEIEKACGGVVSRHELCPKWYPRDAA